MTPLYYLATQFYSQMGVVRADCTQGTKDTGCDLGIPKVGANGAQFQQILSIVLATVSALAVLMIVIGGVRFITAQGNPQEVAKARSTIIYALVGLVVSIAAQLIVVFVLGKLA